MQAVLHGAVQFVVAMAATCCFAVLFRVPKRHYLACGLTGAVGWLADILCLAAGLSAPLSALFAALPLTALSRWFAVRKKAPLTVFLLCGIFPLVPGAGIYYTAYYFLEDERALCLDKGVETLKTAVAIAIGIALVASLPLPKRVRAQNVGK